MSTETTKTTTIAAIPSLTTKPSPTYNPLIDAGTFLSAVLLTAPVILPRARFQGWVGPYYALTLFILSSTIGHYLHQGNSLHESRRPSNYVFSIPIVVAIAAGLKTPLENL